MTLLAEATQKKKEIQELKERKKDHAKERRAERSVQAEQRKQLRMERDKGRQEKQHQKILARTLKDQRKEQERIQREHGRMEELERTANETDQRRMVSNSLDQIADNTRLFQDLVNIQLPLYHPVGPSPLLFLLV